MATLFLTPDRCAPVGTFENGSYAYAYADRPVRRFGRLITPMALIANAGVDGAMAFQLIPASEADDQKVFSYTVSVFDARGDRMWSANIVMPPTDAICWDLIPQSVDLDAPIHRDYECPIPGRVLPINTD